MPHDLFISYASRDKGAASRVRSLLEESGMTCWIDSRDIPGATVWSAEIVGAIRASGAIVLLLSRDSNRSEFVAGEIGLAAESGKPVLTIRLQNVTPSEGLALFLNRLQWLDAFPGPVDLYAGRIVQSVAAALNRDVPLPPSWWVRRRTFLAATAAALGFGAWIGWPRRHARDNANANIRGRVVDGESQSGIGGARVNLAQYESEPVVTGAAGEFELDAHAPAGTYVGVHAEKSGYVSADQYHFAGSDPMTITLTRQTAAKAR